MRSRSMYSTIELLQQRAADYVVTHNSAGIGTCMLSFNCSPAEACLTALGKGSNRYSTEAEVCWPVVVVARYGRAVVGMAQNRP